MNMKLKTRLKRFSVHKRDLCVDSNIDNVDKITFLDKITFMHKVSDLTTITEMSKIFSKVFLTELRF